MYRNWLAMVFTSAYCPAPTQAGQGQKSLYCSFEVQRRQSNDILLNRPDLLRNLVGTIFRFRENQTAVTADNESKFVRVAVPKKECEVIRFIWCDNPEDSIGSFEYNRHVFWSITCYSELVETLNHSGFTLKKWADSCTEVLITIPIEDRV